MTKATIIPLGPVETIVQPETVGTAFSARLRLRALLGQDLPDRVVEHEAHGFLEDLHNVTGHVTLA